MIPHLAVHELSQAVHRSVMGHSKWDRLSSKIVQSRASCNPQLPVLPPQAPNGGHQCQGQRSQEVGQRGVHQEGLRRCTGPFHGGHPPRGCSQPNGDGCCFTKQKEFASGCSCIVVGVSSLPPTRLGVVHQASPSSPARPLPGFFLRNVAPGGGCHD